MREALFYQKLNGGFVQCGLCPHLCRIAKDKTGICKVRKNNGGVLTTESYGRISGLSLDPIEKKPLKMFYPKSFILSVGSYGCNMKCAYCQNHSISQSIPQTRFILPEELLAIAKSEPDNLGIAFTYNEPLISIEYILDTAPLFKSVGLKTVLVTNGMINIEPLKALLPYIDAMNIDFKAFDTEKYKSLKGDLAAVMKTVEESSKACHVEITSLIVPGQNDTEKDIISLSDWLKGISPKIPLHITRFYPRYKFSNYESTPKETLEKLAALALKKLKYVYLGNI